MKILLNSPKNTFLKSFCVSGHFRPIPATNQVGKITKIIKKSKKIAIFRKSIFCSRVAGNMIFDRKSALWIPESPQKPYIDHPT